MIDKKLHPYEVFPIRLEYGKKKDKVVCHFTCIDDLKKHISRYKLKSTDIKVSQRNGEEVILKRTRKPRVKKT